jgi:hypothetical protein
MFNPSFQGKSFLGGSAIPRTGLIFYAKAPGMTDSIGLSIANYASVPAELQSIFFIDENTLRPTADAYALARVSEYLNMGEMVGRGEGRGIALYADGTAESVLEKACKYFHVTYGEQYYDTDLDGKSVFGTPDIGAYEYS